MNLTKMDVIFLEDPKRMDMGKGKLAKRYQITEQEVDASRSRVKDILAATELISELENNKYAGSVKDIVKTVVSTEPENSTDFQVDIVKRQYESKLRDSADKYKKVLSAYENLSDKYDDVLRIKEFKPVNIIPQIPDIKRQGASIVAVSDWHVGRMIEKKSVNNFNEFNPEVARRRSEKFTDSVVKLINRDAVDFDKHDTVIYLLGDFIEGYIHPESQRIVNSMTPIEEVLFAQELLANSIATILDTSATDRITIVCRTGNHARNTKRMESSVDHRTNYETMLYAGLAQRFKDDVQFNLPTSDIGYTQVLGKTIRDFHGWQVSYGGGIGGLTIPLTKFIQRQDGNRKADFNLLGHFHQLSLPTKDSMLNGSLCGFDTYAQSIGCTKEPALQGYRVIDSRYGFTGFNPIICE